MIKKGPIIKPVAGNKPQDGHDPMYRWACDLFPIYRSLSGVGVRETLNYIKTLLPGLSIKEFKSGTQVFDWTVPDEWEIIDAYIEDESGNKIVELSDHNLHVVGYSEPINKWMTLDDLNEHLFSLPNNPYAIPYVTSYYEKNWGFCLTHKQRELLLPGRYHVVIDSSFKQGVLNYGELIIKGSSNKEILLSTYVCHPSMANNELSGPVLTTAIARYLSSLDFDSRYTYRILFLPETIGSISYLSEHLHEMKKHTIAGFVISCVGDQRDFSIIQSRSGECLSDRVLIHTLRQYCKKPTIYSFLDRGSDERQYCSPGVDLPVVGFSRSKYATFPEYHTSFDDLSLITQKGLEQSYSVMIDVLLVLEKNYNYKTSVLCEPQLGKRGLYHKIGINNTGVSHQKSDVNLIMDFMTFADGGNDMISIAEKIGCKAVDLIKIARLLCDHNLISTSKSEVE